jgi:hypothetical protein
MADTIEAQGKKEIIEAVLIAAISAACVDLLKWGIEEIRTAKKRRQEEAEKLKGNDK